MAFAVLGLFGMVVTSFGAVLVVFGMSFVAFAMGSLFGVVVAAVIRGGLSVSRECQREQADEERRAFAWLCEWIEV